MVIKTETDSKKNDVAPKLSIEISDSNSNNVHASLRGVCLGTITEQQFCSLMSYPKIAEYFITKVRGRDFFTLMREPINQDTGKRLIFKVVDSDKEIKLLATDVLTGKRTYHGGMNDTIGIRDRSGNEVMVKEIL